MGKREKGYNWEARTNKQVVIDNSEKEKVCICLLCNIEPRRQRFRLSCTMIFQIQVDASLLDDCDDPNLILPSKKRKTVKVKEQAVEKRPLSKKERRKLESVVNRKQKKERVSIYCYT